MSDLEKPTPNLATYTLPVPELNSVDPSTVSTAELLNPSRARETSAILKPDIDIMRTYDLNEENLRNLKHLRKFSL